MLEFIQGLFGSGVPTVSQHAYHTDNLTSTIDLLHWLPQKYMNDKKSKKNKKYFDSNHQMI